jgi:putative nucleotidyltransferase with HDIG domain
MLKKIPVSQLRLGMHLHKLDGAWIAHPFWKTRFVIDSAADLQRLHDCGVADCWIDVDLGLDVAHPDALQLPVVPVAAASAVLAPPSAAEPSEPQRALAAELKEAAAICSRGREAVVAMFSEVRMGRTVDAEGCLPLVEEIASSVGRNPGAVVSLARLKTKDDYTYMHSVAVCALMVSLARQLGLDEDACRVAGLAGLLHDIGKAMMPLDVLNKPGKLTEPEFAIMRSHPARGHQLLLEGRGCSDQTLDVVLHHHERVDGTGYPHRLAGDGITALARMGAVCDVYDAITSNRPYKAGWDPAESIARMASWKGHFDGLMFTRLRAQPGHLPDGLAGAPGVRPPGRGAGAEPASLVTPVVKVFFSTKSQMPIPTERLDLAARGCSDRIVGRETREPGRFAPGRALGGPDTLRHCRS